MEAPAETQPPAPPHPTPALYVKIFVALFIITAIEVALSYSFDLFGEFTTLMLLVASALKFALVVGFYMHLRYENRLLSRFFAGGFVLAISVYAVALAALGAAIFFFT
ncbi:MAG: cytochrome C oxidase subunit IV family protein [Acidimicrobiia bacterium]